MLLTSNVGVHCFLIADASLVLYTFLLFTLRKIPTANRQLEQLSMQVQSWQRTVAGTKSYEVDSNHWRRPTLRACLSCLGGEPLAFPLSSWPGRNLTQMAGEEALTISSCVEERA